MGDLLSTNDVQRVFSAYISLVAFAVSANGANYGSLGRSVLAQPWVCSARAIQSPNGAN